MLNIKGIVQQLSEEEFKGIAEKLKKNKADKFYALFNSYRTNNLPNDEICHNLEVTANAFYVLKSRLFQKIQEHLLDKQAGPKTDLLRKLVTIPNLLFDKQRDLAITILTKLEKELLGNDMPNELTTVYSALKKLHLHSDKYYEYTQLYNKHVAYTLALDKAEDLLAGFIKSLGEFYASRRPQSLEVFPLMKKEVDNISRLYESHHLQVYKNILDASIAVFLPLEDVVINDDPVEDILKETKNIISKYPKDANYRYILNVVNFLYFEFYQKLGLHKKADQYYGLIHVHLPSFLYYNHFTFCSRLLISKIERYITMGIEHQLYEENKKLFENFQADKLDVPGYINYIKYLAASAFYARKIDRANKLLNGLLNDISFKDYPHAEIEIKLFLALTYSFADKYELSWTLLRNTLRKIREVSKEVDYENALVFANMLKIQNSQRGNVGEKLLQLRNKFQLLNRGPTRLLEFVKLDDSFLKELAKPLKT